MRWADTPRAMALVRAPVAEPLTYAQARAFLSLPDDTNEAIVAGLIKMARQKVEQDTGRLLMTQTWDLSFDAFPSDAIRPPCYPLQSVTSITTVSTAGASSVLTASNYQVDLASWPPRIALSDSGAWPADLRAIQAITIRLVAGYATAAAIEEPLILAMEHAVAIFYQYRTGQPGVLPPRWMGYDALIAPYRLPGMA